MDMRRNIARGETLLLALTALFLSALTALALRDRAAGPGVAVETAGAGPVRLETLPSGDDEDAEERSPLLDVNDATAEELAELPGIGAVLAGRIVDCRTANGPFASVEDLLEVSGIGPAKLEQIRPYICVGDGQG